MSLRGFGGTYALSLIPVFFLYFESPPKGAVWLIFINSLLVLLIFSVLRSCRWKYKEVKYGIWAFLRIEKDPADDFQLVHEFLFFCEYSFLKNKYFEQKERWWLWCTIPWQISLLCSFIFLTGVCRGTMSIDKSKSQESVEQGTPLSFYEISAKQYLKGSLKGKI